MSSKSSGLVPFIRKRIFVKYILVTIAMGFALNVTILTYYYQYREAQLSGQVAAEIATIANRIAPQALEFAKDGDSAGSRQLLSVLDSFPYVVCVDLKSDENATPLVSWPTVGCARIKKQGDEIDLPIRSTEPGPLLRIRIDPVALTATLDAEFLILAVLALVGGLCLIIAGAVAFLWFINRPITMLIAAINKFQINNDPERVAYRSKDEIGTVVSSYNAMLDREVERVNQIKEAHKSILDSVNYATRIQKALLPTHDRLEQDFHECAVLWQPRDLVGGDIYWVHSDGARSTVVLLDCTGHGVPGGFMTMLAIATLERIFIENDEVSPGTILSRLSDLTRGLLSQDVGSSDSNDGMDAAVCQFEAGSGTVTFAGARLSLIVSDGSGTKRLNGDRMSIGYTDTSANPVFTEHKIRIDEGMKFFLSTDGVVDQIGGPKKIAFGYRRLISVIDENRKKDLQTIIEAVVRELDTYAGDETRRDDVAVIALMPHVSEVATLSA